MTTSDDRSRYLRPQGVGPSAAGVTQDGEPVQTGVGLKAGGTMTADDNQIEARVATLERQMEWLVIELERIRTVLVSTATMTSQDLAED